MKAPSKLLRGGAETEDDQLTATLLKDLPPQYPDDLSVERVWRRVNAPPPKTSRPWMWIPVGAVALAALVVVLRPPPNREPARPETILASNGTSLLRLPGVAAMLLRDGQVAPIEGAGTRLSLQGGSITCRVSKRPEGEPFVIEADGVSVKVVGTLFTVAHKDGISVSVREGVVEVTDQLGQKHLLTAGRSWNSAAPAGEGRDDTSDRVKDLLEAGLAGANADQLRQGFEHLDVLTNVALPAPAPILPARVAVSQAIIAKAPALRPVVAAPAPKVAEPTAYEQAQQLEMKGDFAAAAEAMEIAIGREPERSELLVKLGRLAMTRLNEPARALGAFQRYRKQFPQGPLLEEVDLYVIEIRLQQNDPDAAIHEMGRFLEMHPKSDHADEIHLRRGNLLREQDDWGLALAEYRSVQKAPALDDALFLRAVSEQHIGDRDSAALTLRNYLARFPNGRHAVEARQTLGDGAQ